MRKLDISYHYIELGVTDISMFQKMGHELIEPHQSKHFYLLK